MQANSPLDSAVIQSEADDDGNDDDNDGKPEDKGKSHTIIVIFTQEGYNPLPLSHMQ